MGFGTDRQMYDVDLTCPKCGTHISQLPFQPTGNRPVYCKECTRAYRQSQDGGRRDDNRGPRAPRQMYQVDVECAQCGVKITELPFQPSDNGKPIYCQACLRAQRNNG